VQEGEEHDHGNDVDEEEEEDDEDDQEMLPIIEKPATVFARWPNDDKWETVGLGNLAIYYDSEIYAERIVLKLDDLEEYASNTIISMDTVMQVQQSRDFICHGSGLGRPRSGTGMCTDVFNRLTEENKLFFDDVVV